MKKWRTAFLMVCIACLLCACQKETDVDTNTVIIDKKGQITEAIVEEFNQPYYDLDELKSDIEGQIASYNAQSGSEEAVILDKIELTEQTVHVNLIFADYNAYTGFNEKELFAGTVADAYSAGYEFPQMKQTDGTVISQADVLELGEKHVVIMEELQQVKVPGRITHISDGVSLVDDKTAINLNEGQTAFIIYE